MTQVSILGPLGVGPAARFHCAALLAGVIKGLSLCFPESSVLRHPTAVRPALTCSLDRASTLVKGMLRQWERKVVPGCIQVNISLSSLHGTVPGPASLQEPNHYSNKTLIATVILSISWWAIRWSGRLTSSGNCRPKDWLPVACNGAAHGKTGIQLRGGNQHCQLP